MTVCERWTLNIRPDASVPVSVFCIVQLLISLIVRDYIILMNFGNCQIFPSTALMHISKYKFKITFTISNVNFFYNTVSTKSTYPVNYMKYFEKANFINYSKFILNYCNAGLCMRSDCYVHISRLFFYFLADPWNWRSATKETEIGWQMIPIVRICQSSKNYVCRE